MVQLAIGHMVCFLNFGLKDDFVSSSFCAIPDVVFLPNDICPALNFSDAIIMARALYWESMSELSRIDGLQLVFVCWMELDLWIYQFMGGYLIGEFTCYMNTIFNKWCASRDV